MPNILANLLLPKLEPWHSFYSKTESDSTGLVSGLAVNLLLSWPGINDSLSSGSLVARI